jgi:endoglucanase
MFQKMFLDIVGRLMRQAAAPYHEPAVQAEVERICGEHGLECARDAFGNIHIHLPKASKLRPLVFAAHLDHPGFEVVRRLNARRFLARFHGGVGDAYFRRDVSVRLMPGAVPARLGKRRGKDKLFELSVARASERAPEFGVWELEDFAARQGRIVGRACDDLVGCACALAALIELKRRRARVNARAILTRAEEVGFQGALTAAAHGYVPKDALVISLETSRELPGVKMGQGVILRVGDRASVFDSGATRFLAEVATGIKDRGFRYQRALMGGGTCEATAYQEYGFQSAAACVALGNYHNCGPGNRIREEFVSLNDALGMARLLVAAARQMPRYERLAGKLPARLRRLLREGERRLA